MSSPFLSHTLWDITIQQSDTLTKVILILLLIMSVICWSIAAFKYILLRMRIRTTSRALAQLQHAKTIDDIVTYISHYDTTSAPAAMLNPYLFQLKSYIKQQPQLEHSTWQALHDTLDHAIDHILYQEESYLSFLSISAAISPLIGLFGTVWGLIHAFIRISQKQSADIVTVAPGIAEALITTLAGLIVAIPALVLYHYIYTYIYAHERTLLQLRDKIDLLVYQACVIKG